MESNDVLLMNTTMNLSVAQQQGISKFAGSHPAEAADFLDEKKILSTPSFGGEVKPSVPCRSFTACKRSLNVTWKSEFLGKILGHLSPTVPPSAAEWRRLVAKVGTSKKKNIQRLKFLPYREHSPCPSQK